MKRIILTALAILFLAGAAGGQDVKPGSSLSRAAFGFENPQDSTRTKTWWFHGKLPSSIQGMTEDLETFKKIGIGGVVFYDQTHGEPHPDTEPAMSPRWWQNVYHAAREADRLGLEFEFHVSNGFVAGGPWITPEHGMKRLECLETLVTGGRRVDVRLPSPENRFGFCKDVMVMAVPTSDSDAEAKISSNIPSEMAMSIMNGSALTDIKADLAPAVIDLDYGKPVTVSSISYLIGSAGKATTSATNVPAPPQETFVGTGYRILPPVGELQWSEDGEVYHKVCDIKPLYRAHESYNRKTVSFPSRTARFFRIRLSGWDGCGNGTALKLGGIILGSDPRINEYEYKAAYISEYEEDSMKSPGYSVSECIPVSRIIDLTGKVDSAGRLKWKAPKGEWKILRFCMVPTGGSLKHGRPNLMGLECDKMSAAAAELQFRSYFGTILDSLDRHGIHNLKGLAMDSHEAGSQNWTDDFLEAFSDRRGYDLAEYLPVMAGYVVNSVAESEAVLYDVRQTVAELIAERYYGTFDTLCRERGIVFTAQATGNAQCIVAIPIEAKGKVGKPQGEFWLIHPDGNYDTKESSSAAHLYGKNVASAEAFTDGAISTMPSDMKSIADIAYSFGINEFVICASAHQPEAGIPGNAGGRAYATYSRNNTWWKASRDFWDYQARISYVMRQGRPVIDLCVYLGGNAPARILTHRLPLIPEGYDFDAFTEDALLNRMTARNGKTELPTGQSYSMMILPRSGEISLEALRKIASMVEAGIIVYGNRPTGSPRKEDIGKEEEYQALVSALWDGNYGKGRVLSGMTLAEALETAGIQPDISGTGLHFTHRETDDCDIYFLYNHSDKCINGTYLFRTKYPNAQIWDPMSGKRYTAESENGRIRLRLAPGESCFAVFTDKAENLDSLPDQGDERLLDGKWKQTFHLYDGSEKTLAGKYPGYWSDSSDPDIRYFSGTVIYETEFACPESISGKMLLKLEPGRCLSVVYVNGRRAGSIWASPWTLDITPFVRPGKNELRIEVTNSWNNRLVGDLPLDKEKRVSSDPEFFVNEDTALENAGIKGGASITGIPE